MDEIIKLNRTHPANILSSDLEFFEQEFHRKIKHPKILVVKNSTITSQGIVFEGSRLKVESLIIGTSLKGGIFVYLKQILFKKKRQLKNSEVPAVIFDSWYEGYFHWITDTLPRILFLVKSQISFVLLIPGSASAFILDSLKPFEIKIFHTIHSNEYIKAKEAILVEHTAPTGNYNVGLVNELRNIYRLYFKQNSDEKLKRKIYVSREKSSRRKIINENQVSELLSSYGFETVYFEDYSFQQQVVLALNTQFMIGVHGAGLTNMLFMNEHASILEFRHGGDRTNLCYFSLASALNIKYFYQFGNVYSEFQSVNTDMDVDINQLKINVEMMLSQVNDV